MLNIKFLDDIFKEHRKYQILPQEDETSILKDVTEYTQEGTKINALIMQQIIDEINDNSPIGVIHPYAGINAPKGYLICDGKEVSRETYAKLFETIGTTYGAGNGTSTFLLPNLLGKTVIGSNTEYPLSSTGGKKDHTLSVEEMPSHTHTQTAHTHTATGSSTSVGAHTHGASSTTNGGHAHSISGTANAGGEHNHLGLYYYDNDYGVTFTTASGYGSMRTSYWTNYENVQNCYPEKVRTGSSGYHAHSLSGSTSSTGGHAHTISVVTNGNHTHGINIGVNSTIATNASAGGNKPYNNMMPYVALNYIIKY